jgi:DNA-binding transcriptional regulator GbsR (MarR family)
MSSRRSRIGPAAITDWIERMSAFCGSEYGLPPTAGRVLGWLMICDPPEQTAAQIGAAIGASPASLSTNMRLLTDAKFVVRRGQRGARTQVYRVEDDAWESVVRQRIASLTEFRDLTADGVALAGGTSNPRASRLQTARDVYDWMAKCLTAEPMPAPRKQTYGR